MTIYDSESSDKLEISTYFFCSVDNPTIHPLKFSVELLILFSLLQTCHWDQRVFRAH